MPFSSRPAEIRAIHIVLDVFLARPDDLDGAVNVFGDLNGASDAVDFQPTAKPAADQVIVDHDFFQRQTRNPRRRGLGSPEDLAADPDLATILADMDRAV